jgi:hypothetical protein
MDPTNPVPCNQTLDAGQQIACLVSSDACSIGFARLAVAGGASVAQAVNGISPTQPNIQTVTYPLSERLYLHTLVGFSNLRGGELELAQCFADNGIVSAAIQHNGFLPPPLPGIRCLDYVESASSFDNPQINSNFVMTGCNSPTNVDACRTSPPGTFFGATGTRVLSNVPPGASRDLVQQIVSSTCLSCHNGNIPPNVPPDLNNIQNLIGTLSSQCPTKPMINAVTGGSATSYLVDKILGGPQDGGCFVGTRMPAGQPQLSPSDIAVFTSWINAGAP